MMARRVLVFYLLKVLCFAKLLKNNLAQEKKRLCC